MAIKREILRLRAFLKYTAFLILVQLAVKEPEKNGEELHSFSLGWLGKSSYQDNQHPDSKAVAPRRPEQFLTRIQITIRKLPQATRRVC